MLCPGAVQPLIALLGAGPDAVLERVAHIHLVEALDDKCACRKGQIGHCRCAHVGSRRHNRPWRRGRGHGALGGWRGGRHGALGRWGRAELAWRVTVPVEVRPPVIGGRLRLRRRFGCAARRGSRRDGRGVGVSGGGAGGGAAGAAGQVVCERDRAQGRDAGAARGRARRACLHRHGAWPDAVWPVVRRREAIERQLPAHGVGAAAAVAADVCGAARRDGRVECGALRRGERWAGPLQIERAVRRAVPRPGKWLWALAQCVCRGEARGGDVAYVRRALRTLGGPRTGVHCAAVRPGRGRRAGVVRGSWRAARGPHGCRVWRCPDIARGRRLLPEVRKARALLWNGRDALALRLQAQRCARAACVGRPDGLGAATLKVGRRARKREARSVPVIQGVLRLALYKRGRGVQPQRRPLRPRAVRGVLASHDRWLHSHAPPSARASTGLGRVLSLAYLADARFIN